MEETMRALDDLVRQGKVLYLGCSNLFGWQIAKEEKTRPEQDSLTFFNKLNHDRHFAAAEFHNERAELP